ncbi:MAG TPA: hypothetical protein VGJ04_12735 [Pirellulales bacterium]
MYVIDYLAEPTCNSRSVQLLTTEYRLLCSGILYRDVVGDPYKSELSRILLNEPLVLFALNRPLDQYPLELAIVLTTPLVEEKLLAGDFESTFSFHPSDEVVGDLAALLSLLCRRLITVSGKVSEKPANYRHPLFGHESIPMAVSNSFRRIYWRPHPLMVLYSLDGTKYEDYNPQPKAIDPIWLTKMLLQLPQLENASSIVSASRLYASALEMIHSRPDITYQLLISSIETIANSVLSDFQPDDAAKLKHKMPVYRLAIDSGVSEETAKKLAIEACKGDYWATRKFKKFILDNVGDSIWNVPDELFHKTKNDVFPKQEDFEDVLGEIYQVRSKATHRGERFPHSSAYTGGPNIDVRAANQLFNPKTAFPPVIWFERVVNESLRRFWDNCVMQLNTNTATAAFGTGKST